MREIVGQLLKQTEYEIKAAKDNLKLGNYSLVAFLAQQSVAKILKAAYIIEKKDAPEQTHNLRVLAGKLDKVEPAVVRMCARLNPHYFQSRYPDASNDVPYELYDKDLASDLLGYAEEIYEYFKKRDGLK
jgi:HEPN domain-containing protein